MFLSEGIIDNFIEAIDEADMLKIGSLENDEDAFQYIAQLYRKNYGANPAGTGIYLLRTKFNLGRDEVNQKFIPSALL